MMRVKIGISALILLAIANQVARSQIVTLQNHKIMIFGGEDHKVYLGCLNCTQYASDSVQNKYTFGSQYQSESIFNRYGEYGSPYSDTSACNRYASDPPVIVDESGGFYGRLTINKSHSEATHSEALLSWIEGVCSGQ
jgi:hypothetical protein